MGAQMRKLMQATGQAVPEAQPILEINPAHPLLLRLAARDRRGPLRRPGPARWSIRRTWRKAGSWRIRAPLCSG